MEKWQVRIEEKLGYLDDLIRNHVMTQLERLNGRMWRLVFTMVSALAALSVALLLALMRG